jgi:hypothetical protein
MTFKVKRNKLVLVLAQLQTWLPPGRKLSMGWLGGAFPGMIWGGLLNIAVGPCRLMYHIPVSEI